MGRVVSSWSITFSRVTGWCWQYTPIDLYREKHFGRCKLQPAYVLWMKSFFFLSNFAGIFFVNCTRWLNCYRSLFFPNDYEMYILKVITVKSHQKLLLITFLVCMSYIVFQEKIKLFTNHSGYCSFLVCWMLTWFFFHVFLIFVFLQFNSYNDLF